MWLEQSEQGCEWKMGWGGGGGKGEGPYFEDCDEERGGGLAVLPRPVAEPRQQWWDRLVNGQVLGAPWGRVRQRGASERAQGPGREPRCSGAQLRGSEN